ncbi:MAG: protein kinase [Frankia sp.]|nr:protein kinase [Frankia sp.]
MDSADDAAPAEGGDDADAALTVPAPRSASAAVAVDAKAQPPAKDAQGDPPTRDAQEAVTAPATGQPAEPTTIRDEEATVGGPANRPGQPAPVTPPHDAFVDLSKQTTGSPGAPPPPAPRSAGERAVLPNGQFVGPPDEPDRYELLGDPLGGGEGVIWRARYRGHRLQSPLPVAVKMMGRPYQADQARLAEADLQRWKDAARLLQSIRSEHIADLYEVFSGPEPHTEGAAELDGPVRAYLAMEWVEGRTLDDALRGTAATAATVAERLTYVVHIAEAVDRLLSLSGSAGNPALHRDLKPGNCIVHPKRGAVLVDLSTMRLLSDGSDPMGMHTPNYTAPEVIAAPRAHRLPAADLYSVGAIAYFCLTGEHPPAMAQPSPHAPYGMTPDDALAVIRNRVERMGRDINAPDPRALADHLVAMLDREPMRRPTDCVAWATSLRALASGEEQGSAGRSGEEQGSARRWAKAVAAAVSVAAVVIALFFGVRLLTGDGGDVDAEERTPGAEVSATPGPRSSLGPDATGTPTPGAEETPLEGENGQVPAGDGSGPEIPSGGNPGGQSDGGGGGGGGSGGGQGSGRSGTGSGGGGSSVTSGSSWGSASLRGVLSGHSGPVWSTAISPDGSRVASGSSDGTVKVWSLGSASLIGTGSGHSGWVGAVAFSPKGGVLASGGVDGTVRLWSVGGGAPQQVGVGSAHTDTVWSLAFSPDGNRLASAGFDGTVRLWDVSNPANPVLLGTATGHSGRVQSVAFSPSGNLVASGGTDRTIRLWDVSDPGNPRQITSVAAHGDTVWKVAFSPSGNRLASASNDRTAKVWNVSSGGLSLVGTASGHTASVGAVAFTPDGRTLATGSVDQTARLWDVSGAPRHIGTLTGHADDVLEVAFSPDGRTLATASYDGTLRLWNSG